MFSTSAQQPCTKKKLGFAQLKGTVTRDFLLQVYYLSSFLGPLITPLTPFQVFLKICEDIHNLRGTPKTAVVTSYQRFTLIKATPVENLPPVPPTPSRKYRAPRVNLYSIVS
jgi:hypothetical protein